MIGWPIKNVCAFANVLFYLLTLLPQDLNSEDVQEVPADDEDAVPDAVLPLLEQYPLNTTLGIGDPLTSDEVARKCPHGVLRRVSSALC
jgi:hypothetical protein